jgi:TP901 family phage tail tape measure protein
MADRVVKVSLTAQVSNYLAGMESARKATAAAGSEAEIAARKVEAQNQAMQEAGRGLMAVGVVAIAATALSVKAAIDWESAWAGVTKTVEGTPAELARVEEAAGQLGIQTASVTAFTRTMIDLGETTNLSAEEAATSLARFMNVMGTSQDDVERLGSAIVELGNNYATTEAEIVAMSMRLSGAGKQVGLSEGQVLGLATALSSVGIEAEAGGSAISKVMIDIASSVDSGGERVAQFAKVAGVSAEDFTKQWKTDPGAALAGFVTGLGDAESQGKSTIGILEDLGITEVRMRDALLRSASASDIFTEAMVTGTQAFEDNNALANEAAKRYETVQAKLQVMANRVEDAAISFGQVFLPAVTAAADAVGGFADLLGGMDPTLQGIVAAVGLLGGAIALGGGIFLLAVPKIVAYQAALVVLSTSAIPAVAAAATGMMTATTKAATAMGVASKFMLGPWGIAVAAAASVLGILITQNQEMQEQVNLHTEALKENSGALGDNNRQIVINEMQSKGAFDAAETLGLGLDVVTDAALGNTQAMRTVKERLDEVAASAEAAAQDQSLYTAEQVKAEGAANTLDQMINIQNTTIDNSREAFKQQAEASKDSTDSVSKAGDAFQDTADKAKALDDKIMELMGSMNELNGVGQDASAANIAYQQSLDDLDEQIALNNSGAEGYATTLDIGTEAGRNNRAMLDELAASNQAAAEAQFELDGDTAAYKLTLEAGHQAVYDRAIALGANADEAKRIADEIAGIPDESTWTVFAETANAEAKLRAFLDRWNGASVNLTTKVSGRLGSGILQGPDSASGGILPGAPSATDNMYIHAASGEFVTNARSTADPANRRALEFMNNGGSIQGYSNGGMVRPQYVTGGGGGGSSYSTVGDTFQASFQLAPLAGRSLSDQAFEAARRLKLRR